MRDLLIITPSRGRPEQLEAMLRHALTNALSGTVDNSMTGQRVWWHTAPRNDLTGWTNHLALKYADRYRFLASLGDDHRPDVIGWDRKLAAAGAIAYGNDLYEGPNLPTAVVIRSDIVKALGEGADCLAYCEDVIIEHLHPLFGTAPRDDTYVEAITSHLESDQAAYQAWFRYQRPPDIVTVKTCLNRQGEA